MRQTVGYTNKIVLLLAHPLIFLLGLAEQLQDVDGLWLCDTIGPPWLRPLWRPSLGVVCFLFYNPTGEETL